MTKTEVQGAAVVVASAHKEVEEAMRKLKLAQEAADIARSTLESCQDVLVERYVKHVGQLPETFREVFIVEDLSIIVERTETMGQHSRVQVSTSHVFKGTEAFR